MAQSIAGTSLAANAAKVVRQPSIEFNIAWGRTPDTIPTNWSTQATNEYARIRSINWTRQLDMKGPLAQGSSPVAALTVELDNYDNRYSPFNSAGALYASLLASTTTAGGLTVQYPKVWQVPIQLKTGFENERVTSFTGLIDEPGESYGVNGSTVSYRCFDVGGMLLKRKFSTALRSQINTGDWITYLAQVGGVTALDVDHGFFYLPYAWLDDEDVYSEATKAAASEGGYFFFSETGTATFRNAAWWATRADSKTSVYTFTVAKFTDITPGYDWKSLATGARVEYQGRQPAGEQTVWKSSGVLVVPPGLSSIEARLEYPCEEIYPPSSPMDWLPINAGGVPMLENIGVILLNQAAQRTRIAFSNLSHETAFITRMQLRGRALYGGPTEQIDRNVDVALVPANVVRISDNPYIQTLPQAALVADLSVDRMQYPRLTYRINGAPAIPWLQLGDRVTITATEPITTSREAILTKLDYSWQPNGRFSMNVEAVDAAGLFQYAKFFVLGTSAYGSADEVLFR